MLRCLAYSDTSTLNNYLSTSVGSPLNIDYMVIVFIFYHSSVHRTSLPSKYSFPT